MSTIKSSAENLTLNADGSGNDVLIQSNGSTKVTVDGATGNVGIGTTPESGQGSNSQGLYVGTHASLISSGAYESVNLSENAYLATAASDAWKYRDTSHAARHEMKAGVHTLKVAASGSADAAITWNTGFEVLNDGKARAKNGLLFGTDTAASNAISDYEEGTFTPTSSFTTKNIVASNCLYTKVGRMVHVQIYFTAVPNSVNWNMGNLPFTSVKSSTWSIGAGNNLYLQSFGRIDANSTSFVGLMSGTSSSNTEFYISLTYATAT